MWVKDTFLFSSCDWQSIFRQAANHSSLNPFFGPDITFSFYGSASNLPGRSVSQSVQATKTWLLLQTDAPKVRYNSADQEKVWLESWGSLDPICFPYTFFPLPKSVSARLETGFCCRKKKKEKRLTTDQASLWPLLACCWTRETRVYCTSTQWSAANLGRGDKCYVVTSCESLSFWDESW